VPPLVRADGGQPMVVLGVASEKATKKMLSALERRVRGGSGLKYDVIQSVSSESWCAWLAKQRQKPNTCLMPSFPRGVSFSSEPRLLALPGTDAPRLASAGMFCSCPRGQARAPRRCTARRGSGSRRSA